MFNGILEVLLFCVRITLYRMDAYLFIISLGNEVRMFKKGYDIGNCCFLHSFENGSFTQEMGNYPLLKTFDA